jgi:cytochrome c-type biogenesis protein CcmH/NrfG
LLISCKQSARDRDFDDPAQAAAVVRAAVDSCDGVTRILDRLARARVTGRLLSGLVDDALASARCDDLGAAVKGHAAAHQLARARLSDERVDDALAQLTTLAEPAIRYRRAELLDRAGRSHEALRELDAVVLDDEAIALQRMLRTSVAARTGKSEEVSHVIAAAPLAERPRLAYRAVADASVEALAALSLASTPELALAAADRLEELKGPAVVLAARERIATLDAGVAEHWDALGRARIASGAIDEALAAWDRAIEIAPAQPVFRTAPIRALVIAEQGERARGRAIELAKHARAGTDVELLVTASAGAAAAGDAKLAIELAREARARRATDGRLGFLVAQRLAEAGEHRAAASSYAELLVCGAHGRPWHRHEVAGKLLELARKGEATRTVVLGALAEKRECAPVEPDDLATYVAGLQKR